MLTYTLLQINPEAAHAFAEDAEMDACQDRVYNRSRSATHCRDKPPGPTLHGLGFYANQYPQSATRKPHADFLPALAKSSTPALIIKGRCDDLSWSSAQEYLRALPDSRLLYLDGSGHNAYQDEPKRYIAEVRAFLTGRTLPECPYVGPGPCSGVKSRGDIVGLFAERVGTGRGTQCSKALGTRETVILGRPWNWPTVSFMDTTQRVVELS